MTSMLSPNDYLRSLSILIRVNPQTVFYAGYSDNARQNDDLDDLTKDRKTLFVKFSYAWLI